AVVLVGALVLNILVRRFAPRARGGTIIELDLAAAPEEEGTAGKLASLKPNKPLALHEVSDALARAARDKRVAGLVVRPHLIEAPPTTIEELHRAIRSFGDSGKFTVAVVDSFGEDAGGNASYLLATACDEICMQESGMLALRPLSSEANFYPDLLGRMGIEVEVFGRGKYKSAPDRFT